MRKSFFLSIIALAAAVGCSKSEIVETKFDKEIGFNTYVGRDAMTKATVATSFTTAGIYGFYTAGNQWDYDGSHTAEGTTAEGWVRSPKANLWVNDELSWDGSVEPVKFWTNDVDYYSFVAYAPKDDDNLTVPAKATNEEETNVANPTIKYVVPNALTSQIDLLYANALNVQKTDADADGIDMLFKHALARLTVNAKVSTEVTEDFDFYVKKISLNGGFIIEDDLNLATGLWAKNGTAVDPTTEGTEATETTPAVLPVYATTYTFFNNKDNKTALTTANTEYANTFNADGTTTENNYLMMIPVNFTEETAYLTVEYTTFYEGTESTVNTATFPVNTNFEQGKAYAINLTFNKEFEAIKFDIDVEIWKESTTGENGEVTDDHQQDENIEA